MVQSPSAYVPSEARRGRGSLSRNAGRYEKFAVDPFDDGWGSLDDPAPRIRTEIFKDNAKSVITYNKSPDISFDRSINPYRGCEHGCVYCFARPTHAWLGLSPGIDFESQIFAKEDAAERLEEELSKPGYVARQIALGVNTDCYQPAEKKLRITRRILEVLDAYNHPVTIVTKSQLIARDMDILARMARKGLVSVFISVTTLSRPLARRMEPRAATPPRRLETIKALSDMGIDTGVLVAPVIPGLTDDELENILEAAASAGAQRAGYVLLRMPHEIKQLFREWLEENYPDRAKKIIGLVQSMRGGKDYDSTFGLRMRGSGPYAELIRSRFHMTCKRLGLVARSNDLGGRKFAPPARPNDGQLSLFEEAS
jgi:DNA repair photolyase